jgi:hypothetical protein
MPDSFWQSRQVSPWQLLGAAGDWSKTEGKAPKLMDLD